MFEAVSRPRVGQSVGRARARAPCCVAPATSASRPRLLEAAHLPKAARAPRHINVLSCHVLCSPSLVGRLPCAAGPSAAPFNARAYQGRRHTTVCCHRCLNYEAAGARLFKALEPPREHRRPHLPVRAATVLHGHRIEAANALLSSTDRPYAATRRTASHSGRRSGAPPRAIVGPSSTPSERGNRA
jgi:hypothetical protein